MHASWAHIGGNLQCILVLGYFIERAIGKWKYILINITINFFGSAFAMPFHKHESWGIGASVFGVGLFPIFYALAFT